MYKKPVPLSRERHATRRLVRPATLSFALNQPVVPIYPAELRQAATEFPLVFLPENGSFTIAGLLSLDGQRNIMLSTDGRWLGNYVPAGLRRYPFILGRADQPSTENADVVLCIDETEEVVSDSKGEPFFDESGEPTPFIKEVIRFLSELERNRPLMTPAIEALRARNLFQPLELQTERDGKQVPVSGLFRINEQAFKKLGEEDVLALHRVNALELVHYHLASLTRLTMLQKLRALHAQAAAQQQQMLAQQQQAQALNMDDMFEGGPSAGDMVFRF